MQSGAPDAPIVSAKDRLSRVGMRVACVHYCSTHVHSARAHRAHRALVRLGHVLAHGQRVGSDTCNVESVDQETHNIESVVDRQDTMISRTKQGTTKAVDQGIKARTGKAPTLRPRQAGRQVAGKEGGSEGDRLAQTPPVEGGSVRRVTPPTLAGG